MLRPVKAKRGFAEGVFNFIRGSHSYSKTLNLPTSKFPNRPSRAEYPQLIKETSDDLYKWQLQHAEGPTHILHDGPPYANGDLHIGHALNKILKDIINRYNVLQGRKVVYVPGWDCHGLPIELASLKQARKKGKSPKTISERRELASKLAHTMIEKQKSSFREFAIMADWDNDAAIYRTMNSDYVVRQLRVFAQMMDRGLIFRQRKPVFWSVESGTALAESELQYGEQTSASIFVRFPLELDPSGANWPILQGASLVIWTTTPWSLPANRAIAVHRKIIYSVIDSPEYGRIIVAEQLREQFATAEPIAQFTGEQLVGLKYRSPLTQELLSVVDGDHVTDSSGTGLVHTAPGHGREDYLVAQKYGLDILSPVDDEGRYTNELPSALADLVGLNARTEGSAAVIERLEQTGHLFGVKQISHSVAHDWRSKKPVIIRSTPQFFIDLGEVQEKAIQSLEDVTFKPHTGHARLKAFISSRTDWCVSRQRVWGVPIPVLYDRESGDAIMDSETTHHIIDHIEQLGTAGLARWFKDQDDVTEWLPTRLASVSGAGTRYRKGIDTMDVWFDSGTSWTQLPDHEIPVSYYLEGSDQHRGWFQSSLLTHVAVKNASVSPYKKLITHGFVLDEKQQKMSKSLGNVVAPAELINGNSKFPALGIDGLRLLLAQTDYTGDITISPAAANQVAALVKKLRLTFKYLLGNLADYTPPNEPPALSPLDLNSLNELANLIIVVQKAYEEHNFGHVVAQLQTHMNSHLSAFYFDTSKDILYADSAVSPRRRAIQYVLHQILAAYVRIVAPIAPLLAQEVWSHSPDFITEGAKSPFVAGWPRVDPKWADAALAEDFKGLLHVRGIVTEVIETARSNKKVGSSLACDVYIDTANSPYKNLLERYHEDLDHILIASKVFLSNPDADHEWFYSLGDETKVYIVPPSGDKCPRCWVYVSDQEDRLCQRCEEATGP